MTPLHTTTADELLATVFSDEPPPDIQAAVVVSHLGDECLGASWLLSRLADRVSVFRLTSSAPILPDDPITLTGVPAARCHDLGLQPGTLSHDLEALTWLISAAVNDVHPRLLITHAWEGVSLDHDAVAFAVHMTAQCLPRFGGLAPLVVEFQCHHESLEAVHREMPALVWQQGVRVDFGPESRRLKEQILKGQLGATHVITRAVLRSETYRPRRESEIPHTSAHFARPYHDAPWCTPHQFRTSASAVARTFAERGLIGASRA